MKYNVFVSYRRSDAFTANLVAEKLRNLGYSVFFDVETLRGGDFNAQLYEVIGNCKDLVLILPPNALDRCISEDDWIRKEVCYAMKCQKNIIPVLLSGFDWPQPMPEGMEQLMNYQAVKASSVEYFDMSIKKLATYLKSKPRIKRKLIKRIYTIAICVLAIIVLGLSSWQFTTHRVCADIVDKFSHDISVVDLLYTQTTRLSDIWEDYKTESQGTDDVLSQTMLDSVYLGIIADMRAEAENFKTYLLMDSVFTKQQVKVCARYKITEADLNATLPLTKMYIDVFTQTCDFISNNIQTMGATELVDLLTKMNIESSLPSLNAFFYNYLATLASFPKYSIVKYRQYARNWKNFSTIGGVNLSQDEYIAASEQEANKADNIVAKYVAEVERLKRELTKDIVRQATGM